MQTIIERIGLIIKNKELSTRAFELSIGASNGMIGRAILKNTDISATWLSKIIEMYPDINSDWLLSGKGDMILQSENDSQNIFNTKTPKNALKSFEGEIEGEIEGFPKLQKTPSNNEDETFNTKTPENVYKQDVHKNVHTIVHKPKLQKTCTNDDEKPAALKVPEREPGYMSYGMPKEPEAVFLEGGKAIFMPINSTGKSAAVRTLEIQQIPLYEFEATAGISNMLDMFGVPIGQLSLPNLPQCDGAIYVRGNSMAPLLRQGDMVVFKLNNSVKYILWGDIYIVSFELDGDDYTVVKMIRKSSQPDHVNLESYNAEEYPPMEVPMSAIRQLAHVKAWVHYNTM